jgi:hypothetical protein
LSNAVDEVRSGGFAEVIEMFIVGDGGGIYVP